MKIHTNFLSFRLSWKLTTKTYFSCFGNRRKRLDYNIFRLSIVTFSILLSQVKKYLNLQIAERESKNYIDVVYILKIMEFFFVSFFETITGNFSSISLIHIENFLDLER